MEPIGLLEALPVEVLERARRWERHIVEVVTGRPPDAPQATPPRAGYDPATSTVKDRDAAKATELTATGQPTSARTVTRMRLRYAEQGLWGLVDQRVTRGSDLVGKADERLVTAILAELDVLSRQVGRGCVTT